MNRIQHDLANCVQHLSKLAHVYQHEVDETEKHWADAAGRAYRKRHTTDVFSTIQGLTSELSQAIELFETIGRGVADPDQSL